jgi:hypothetical protein
MALLDRITVARLYDECSRAPIVISENESNLPVVSVPGCRILRGNIDEAFRSRFAGRSDTDVNHIRSVVQNDSTHCPTALAIRTSRSLQSHNVIPESRLVFEQMKMEMECD